MRLRDEVIVLLFVLVAGLLGYAAGRYSVQDEIGTALTIVCQEDEACWDCSTMGNKVCG